MRADGWSSEANLIRLVLACVAVFGVVLVYRVPPMGGFDESFHWRRAVQVSAGGLLARRLGPNDWGGSIDDGALALEARADGAIAAGGVMSEAAFSALSRRLIRRPSRGTLSSFPSTASFSPPAYLPSAAGIAAARIAGAGPLVQLRAGRLGNLFAFLLLVRLVLHLLPFGRLPALVLLCCPTALHLASCFSADPVCNLLPALLVACCLRLNVASARLPPRSWKAILLLLCVLVGLLKPTGFVLSAAVLLVPASLFSSGRAAWTFRIAAMASCILTTMLWNATYPFVPGLYWHTGAEPHAAIRLLLDHPWHAVANLGRNGWNDRWFWWTDGWGRFGGGPGPFHFTVSEALAAAALIGLALLGLSGGSGPPRPLVASMLLLLAVFYVALLLLAFRIGYGSPSNDFIDGVQGRYLLLPEFLLLLALVVVVPERLRPSRLTPLLLFPCLLPATAAVIIALGRYASTWN